MYLRNQLIPKESHRDFDWRFRDSLLLSEENVDAYNQDVRMKLYEGFVNDDDEKPLVELAVRYYYGGENFQVLLAEMVNLKTGKRTLTEKLWFFDPSIKKFSHKKIVNGEVTVLDALDRGYGVPEETPEFAYDGGVTTQDWDPAACIWENSCCYFGDTMYNYCGAGCGVNRDAGGGAIVNTCDVCCYNHDNCLINNSDPCPCHDAILDCLGRYSCPGDTTMGIGIEFKKGLDSCL